MASPKILLLDTENSPCLFYLWGLYQETTSMDFLIKDWFMLSFAYKWLGEKKVTCKALCDYKSYKKDSENDKELLLDLWKLLDEADVVIAHNAKAFDLRKINARLLFHEITPPSPYKVIDTLIEARKYFKFTSNKLNDLCKLLGLGEKVDTGGFQLWKDVLAGKKKAWDKMKRYNKVDVVLLEKIYLKIRPYIANHINLGVYTDAENPVCPKCSSEKIIKRGRYMAYNTMYQRYSCNSCGTWMRGRQPLLSQEKKKSLITNAL